MLQVVEGDTATIEARTVPAGAAITWQSSDENVATVSAGTVNAVATGAVTITATIEVDGVTYSDTCTVEVEAAPVSNIVIDITASDTWNNADIWIKQAYLETDRATYITYDESAEYIECISNPKAGTTSLYADLSLKAEGFSYDDSYDYYLEVEYRNDAFSVPSNTYKLQLVGNTSNVVFNADGWSEYVMEGHTEGQWYTERLPLTIGDASNNRLIALQVRKLELNADDSLYFKARVVREPK